MFGWRPLLPSVGREVHQIYSREAYRIDKLAYIPAMIVGHLVGGDQALRNLFGFLKDMNPRHVATEVWRGRVCFYGIIQFRG